MVLFSLVVALFFVVSYEILEFLFSIYVIYNFILLSTLSSCQFAVNRFSVLGFPFVQAAFKISRPSCEFEQERYIYISFLEYWGLSEHKCHAKD